MKIWQILNSLGVLITASMLYLTIRQVGLILGRLGPIGARSASDIGPRVGENMSLVLEPLDASPRNGKPTLYVFGSDSCGVCVKIRSAAESLAQYWKAKTNIILVYDAVSKHPPSHPPTNESVIPVVRSETLRGKAGITLVPFGVMVDPQGVVLGKGLVNHMSHLESLLELITN